MTAADQRSIVLETLDRVNRALASDPNAMPDNVRPEAAYLRMVDGLLALCDLKELKEANTR